MVFQDRLTQVNNLREQAKLLISRQHKDIGEYWSATCHDLLQTIGEKKWGKGRYSIVNNSDYTVFVVVNYDKSEHSQFYITLNIEDLNVEAIVANGLDLPEELCQLKGFSIIGTEIVKSGPTKTELEKALIEAFQKGPNTDQLPEDILKALEKLPYQIDEYDQRSFWFTLLMLLAGPVTIIVGLFGVIMIPYGVITSLSCRSTGEIIGIVSFLFLWILCLSIIAISIWGVRISNFGRRYNKLTSKKKMIVVISWLPGLLLIPCVSFAFVIAILGFMASLSQESQKSQMKQAVHEELNEHGL